jgi:hypothetical protein
VVAGIQFLMNRGGRDDDDDDDDDDDAFLGTTDDNNMAVVVVPSTGNGRGDEENGLSIILWGNLRTDNIL